VIAAGARRTSDMRLLTASLALAAVALTTAGCGLFSSLSVSDIENDIEKNAPLQLQGSALAAGGASAATTPPSVSADCPSNAKVDDGSHFTCKATVTEFGAVGSTNVTTHNAVVDVNVKDGKAHWTLRVTS
jgi:hypothetical protein